MVAADEAGRLAAELVGEVLGKGMHETGEDKAEVEHTEEAAETIYVETFEQGAAALAQIADSPTI